MAEEVPNFIRPELIGDLGYVMPLVILFRNYRYSQMFGHGPIPNCFGDISNSINFTDMSNSFIHNSFGDRSS